MSKHVVAQLDRQTILYNKDRCDETDIDFTYV